jgi:hypothetical protein
MLLFTFLPLKLRVFSSFLFYIQMLGNNNEGFTITYDSLD